MRIKELREIKGFSQAVLAEKVQTSQRNIGRWENCENEPTYSQLIKIADVLEVSIDYLVGREDDFGNIIIAGESDGLTEEEKELIKCYRSSADAERLALITTARSFAKRKTDAKHSVG